MQFYPEVSSTVVKPWWVSKHYRFGDALRLCGLSGLVYIHLRQIRLFGCEISSCSGACVDDDFELALVCPLFGVAQLTLHPFGGLRWR